MENNPLYSCKVMELFNNPKNVGTMDENDPNVGTGIAGNPSCGDVMKLYIKVDFETRTIVDVKFRTFGCCAAIASASYATELLKNKTLDEAKGELNKKICDDLGLPIIKKHCSVLAEEAITAAIKNWEDKHRLQ